MKSVYLWCFFIILLNQKDTINGFVELLKCYETDDSACYAGTEFASNLDRKGLFECVRDAPEKTTTCGRPQGYMCGLVEIFFVNGDKLIFSGCETTKSEDHIFQLCDKWAGQEQSQRFEKLFNNKIRDHNCSQCEGMMCNLKNPVPVTKKPVVSSSPSSPKKNEEKSDNSVVFPNMALLMLLGLLIYSF